MNNTSSVSTSSAEQIIQSLGFEPAPEARAASEVRRFSKAISAKLTLVVGIEELHDQEVKLSTTLFGKRAPTIDEEIIIPVAEVQNYLKSKIGECVLIA